MTLFRIRGIEVGVQVVNLDMTAKVLVDALSNEEVGNQYYDEFQEQQLSGIDIVYLYTID